MSQKPKLSLSRASYAMISVERTEWWYPAFPRLRIAECFYCARKRSQPASSCDFSLSWLPLPMAIQP
jgi:hypothetical protein